jgi:hypothetical protein
MGHAKIRTLRCQGESLQEQQQLVPDFRVRKHLGNHPVRASELLFLAKKPLVSGSFLPQEQVELMIAEQAERIPLLDHPLDPSDHSRAIGSAIHKVAHKHQEAPLWVCAIFCIPQVPHQILKRLKLSMDISNHIQRTVLRQLRNVATHGQEIYRRGTHKRRSRSHHAQRRKGCSVLP